MLFSVLGSPVIILPYTFSHLLSICVARRICWLCAPLSQVFFFFNSSFRLCFFFFLPFSSPFGTATVFSCCRYAAIAPPRPLPWQRKHSSEQSDWFMISYMSSSSALTSPGKERLIRLNGLKTKSTVDWHPWSVPPSSRNSATPEHSGISCKKQNEQTKKKQMGLGTTASTAGAAHQRLVQCIWTTRLSDSFGAATKEPVRYQRITGFFWTHLDEWTAGKLSSPPCTRHCILAIFFVFCLFVWSV